MSNELLKLCDKVITDHEMADARGLHHPNNRREFDLAVALRERLRGEVMVAGISGEQLSAAWARYAEFFGEVPHGTVKQMSALLELVPKNTPSPRLAVGATRWLQLLAGWERENGTLAAIMPEEYEALIEQIKHLAVYESPRAAYEALKATPPQDSATNGMEG